MYFNYFKVSPKSIFEHKMELMLLLAKRRKELGLNQKQVAEAANSSQKQVSCYEQNLQVPGITKFIEICNVLELDITISKRESKKVLYCIQKY